MLNMPRLFKKTEVIPGMAEMRKFFRKHGIEYLRMDIWCHTHTLNCNTVENGLKIVEDLKGSPFVDEDSIRTTVTEDEGLVKASVILFLK